MTIIKKQDFIQSIADALQFISYYHPIDYIHALHEAYQREESPAAKDAMAQILINSRMCAEGHRPICQDTGAVVVFLQVGMNVQWESDKSIESMVNEAVHQAYTHPDNLLRASMVEDPLGARKNTGDNTPAIIHTEIVSGDKVDIVVMAKGGGSENKARFAVLNPNDDLVDWVVNTVPQLGAGWCPPGVLGIGIGGTAEKAMLLAKQSLIDPIDIPALRARGAKTTIEKMRLNIYDKVNALGIGAQGLGGLTTVLDIKIRDFPTHAASLPVAMIPNCAATRHAHLTLDGSGSVSLQPPRLADWPEITWHAASGSRRVNLDTVTREDIAQWKPGETLLLNGKLLTGRDAVHKRIADLLAQGHPLPKGLDFTNRF
ncbi:MAG: fumarate hydratase, partial [Gammaproteobacteria bacterium]|nr:fumarate hydratase [Gammaproteobacteria bacterium]